MHTTSSYLTGCRRYRTVRTLLPLVLVFGLTSCSEHSESLHWSYSGQSGPEYWATLSSEFRLCGEGTSQSPINLSGFAKGELDPLIIDYEQGGNSVVNNGHTVQVNFESGSSLVVENRSFELKQFHFHKPSENTIEGISFPMEMHLVHADEHGALAVLAVLFMVGDNNTALESIWAEMPAVTNEPEELSIRVNAEHLLPSSREYYRFDGSLTTPPCSEGVLWLVLANQVSVSADQVGLFRNEIGHSNARPVQSLHGRSILE